MLGSVAVHLSERPQDAGAVDPQSAQPYAAAAREAITRLARVPGVTGNSLARANRYNVRFEEIAAEWVATSDLIGATVGPGAADWLDPAHLIAVGCRDGETYLRVVTENAAWVRP